MVDGVPICEVQTATYINTYQGVTISRNLSCIQFAKKQKQKKTDGFPTQNLSQYWSFVQAPASSCKFLDCLPCISAPPCGIQMVLMSTCWNQFATKLSELATQGGETEEFLNYE